MAPRSLANGDYLLVGAVRSARDPNAWYRVQLDAQQLRHAPLPTDGADGAPFRLSCDCVGWIRDQRQAHPRRSCKHTDPFQTMLSRGGMGGLPDVQHPHAGRRLVLADVLRANPLLDGIHGDWSLQERVAPIIGITRGQPDPDPYHWVRLGVRTEDGTVAAGVVGLPVADRPTQQALAQQVAGWAGWMVAATFARRTGLVVGLPPAHFRYEDRRQQGRCAPVAPQPGGCPGAGPALGLGNLLRAADETNQGDGLHPHQRAEALLQAFLGARYAQLTGAGYLDVPSQRPAEAIAHLKRFGPGYAGELPPVGEVVYRVRLDPQRASDKRVRVFVNGHYALDLCIIREHYNRAVPVADAFMSIYLGLLSDELHILRVVGTGNVWGRFSDGHETAGPPPQRLRAA